MSRKLLICYFFVCFFFFSFFASGTVDSIDGFEYLTVARNIYYAGEPTAPPPEYPQKNIYLNAYRAKNGKWYSMTGIGYSLAMVPSVFLSDLLHRIYRVPVSDYFPLESDFSQLFFVSFTNTFFAAILAVTMCAYLKLIGLTDKQSIFWSFLTVVGTNLFAYAKHSFAHMMYLAFLLIVFYCLKKAEKTKQRLYFLSAGLAFGVVVVAYNPVFFLSVPALLVYYLLLFPPKVSFSWLRPQIWNVAAGLFGITPFLLTYFWYNLIRTPPNVAATYGIPDTGFLVGQSKILFEGVWGLLLSPGRSFFLYSPVLILPLLFWHKLPLAKIKAELVATIVLSATFIYFYAIQTLGHWYSWSGESSWGPRYITPLIPLCMVLVAAVVTRLNRLQKILIVAPILLISIWIQLLGVLLPYQIKFGDLQPSTTLNGNEFVAADYGNFIPRFSPIITMSKELKRHLQTLAPFLKHGKFDVQFKEGIDFPFFVGNRPWRGILSQAQISIADNQNDHIRALDLNFSNTKLKNDAFPAKVSVFWNDKEVGSLVIEAEKWGSLYVPLSPQEVSSHNQLLVQYQWVGSTDAKQVIFLTDMQINSEPINLSSLDLTLYDPLASKMSRSSYLFSKTQTPWKLWETSTAVYNSIPDLWWIRWLFFWDLPRYFYVGALIVLGSGLFVSSLFLLRTIKSTNRR